METEIGKQLPEESAANNCDAQAPNSPHPVIIESAAQGQKLPKVVRLNCPEPLAIELIEEWITEGRD